MVLATRLTAIDDGADRSGPSVNFAFDCSANNISSLVTSCLACQRAVGLRKAATDAVAAASSKRTSEPMVTSEKPLAAMVAA